MTLFLTTDERIAEALRDRLDPELLDTVFCLPDLPDEAYSAANECLRHHAESPNHELPVVGILARSDGDQVGTVSRIAFRGHASILDHTSVGRLTPVKEAETSVAALTHAAIALFPSNRIFVLKGPGDTVCTVAIESATVLAAQLERSARIREPSHVGETANACRRLASQRGLSVTQVALLQRVARSASVRLGAVPAPLSNSSLINSNDRQTKQQRNTWFREIVRQLDECARPAI